jgi:glycosyltransferase involved in cell wall biosynthesis
LKNTIGISKGEMVIGNVANIKRIKNHILLLKGFHRVVQAYPDVKLLLIGDVFKGDEQVANELQDYVRENRLQENVVFLGYRADIPELLSIMDVFCLTSHKEGLPISVMEAMAAGLPVVGTDVEGIRDVIIPGQSGLLVENDNADKLANALLLLLSDDAMRSRMGQEAKRLAHSRYSLNRVVTEYGQLFQRLAQQ